jgi:hypothetical protein
MRGAIGVERVLAAVGEREGSGGANLRLVAWELSVEERRLADGWEQAVNDGLVKVAGRDPANDEELWRLTPGGWSALAAAREPL